MFNTEYREKCVSLHHKYIPDPLFGRYMGQGDGKRIYTCTLELFTGKNFPPHYELNQKVCPFNCIGFWKPLTKQGETKK